MSRTGKQNKLGKKTTHKYKKIRSKPLADEWFTTMKVIKTDFENNRINLKMKGLKDRWIYYLEQDGAKFLNSVRESGIDGIPTEFKRGAKLKDDKQVFGFRVALPKETSGKSTGKAKSMLNRDVVSVLVYLNANKKIDYIHVPGLISDNLVIRSIDGYKEDKERNTQKVALQTRKYKKKGGSNTK
jgi:hypothetical protein